MCHFCFNETLEYMKHIIKLMLVLLSMTAMTDSYAQKSDDVEKQVNELVKKYDGKQGITCMKVAKGSGLELLKMALKNEFGKSFLKGVTSITFIDYSEAPEETSLALRKDMDGFISLLQEFDLSEENQFSENDYIRCFASGTDSGTLSDFVIALENDKSKMLLYMAGKISVE